MDFVTETRYSETENSKLRVRAVKCFGISIMVVITVCIPTLLMTASLPRRQRIDYELHGQNAYLDRYHLGDRIYLTVCHADEYVVLDIRRFINDTSTIMGISLNTDQWITLTRLIPSVAKSIKRTV
jgi:hypothetical protein